MSDTLVYLGLCCDSMLTAFSLSSDKVQTFAKLREQILSWQPVSLVCLQKIIGKCISFSLFVPAKLFTREMNLVVSRALKSRNLSRSLASFERNLNTGDSLTHGKATSPYVKKAMFYSPWCHTRLAQDGEGHCWTVMVKSYKRLVTHGVKQCGLVQFIWKRQLLFSYALVLGWCCQESSCWHSGGQLSAAWLLGKAVHQLSFYAGRPERSFWTTVDFNMAVSLQLNKSADHPGDAPSCQLWTPP